MHIVRVKACQKGILRFDTAQIMLDEFDAVQLGPPQTGRVVRRDVDLMRGKLRLVELEEAVHAVDDRTAVEMIRRFKQPRLDAPLHQPRAGQFAVDQLKPRVEEHIGRALPERLHGVFGFGTCLEPQPDHEGRRGKNLLRNLRGHGAAPPTRPRRRLTQHQRLHARLHGRNFRIAYQRAAPRLRQQGSKVVSWIQRFPRHRTANLQLLHTLSLPRPHAPRQPVQRLRQQLRRAMAGVVEFEFHAANQIAV